MLSDKKATNNGLNEARNNGSCSSAASAADSFGFICVADMSLTQNWSPVAMFARVWRDFVSVSGCD